jgi:Na+/H+ antiporter NhaC
MIFWISIRKKGDYGPMATAEYRAAQMETVTEADPAAGDEIAKLEASDKGTVFDLVGPVVILVIFCIASMLYYGQLGSTAKDGHVVGAVEAFANTDASRALALGGFLTLIVAFFWYVPRKIITFKQYFTSLTSGIKAMVPAIIILTLAWSIAGVCRNMLNTGTYLAGLVNASGMPVGLIPAIMFILACAISFSTGTAWGTMGILVPITITVCYQVAPHLTIPTLAAVMGGAVFGDHCSPISDTTILSSTGASCNHLKHVGTQMPYACTVATACFIGHLIAGFLTVALTRGMTTGGPADVRLGTGAVAWIVLPIALVCLVVFLLILPRVFPGKKTAVN